jgi:hypothetical protein
MGNEPIEEEIPLELHDLPYVVQDALEVYEYFQDTWEYMNGNYTGKNLSNFDSVTNLCNIDKDEIRVVYKLVLQIDSIRSKDIANKKPKK